MQNVLFTFMASVLVISLITGCKNVQQTNELSRLGEAKVLPVNQVAFNAKFCAPQNVALDGNSLLIFMIDNSGSNDLRSDNSTGSTLRYIGTDTRFEPEESVVIPGFDDPSSLTREKPNQRYRELKKFIETQESNHIYAFITFSSEAEIVTIDETDGSKKKFMTKDEAIAKIDEILLSSETDDSLSTGDTNYISAFDNLNSHTEDSPGIVQQFLQSIDGLNEDSLTYVSVYFFSDGAPIVSGDEQSYAQINQKLNSFMSLQTYSLNSLDIKVHKSFNTIYYSFPFIQLEYDDTQEKFIPLIDEQTVPKTYVINSELVNKSAELKERLTNMATIYGNGSFYELSGDLDFDSIGIGKRVEKFNTHDPLVLNINAKWSYDEQKQMALYKKDSDADGLIDEDEIRLGCDLDDTDSNDNGIRDGIEGGCSSEMSWSCPEIQRIDEDGDGLSLCEEKYLMGLDINDPDFKELGPDQNNNHIPDFLEVYIGLSLESDQSLADFDDDGVENIVEIIQNTPVFYHNNKVKRNLSPQSYKLDQLPASPDSSQLTSDCYQLNIDNLRIVEDEKNAQVKMWFKSESFLTGNIQFSELKETKTVSDSIDDSDFKFIGAESAP